MYVLFRRLDVRASFTYTYAQTDEFCLLQEFRVGAWETRQMIFLTAKVPWLYGT